MLVPDIRKGIESGSVTERENDKGPHPKAGPIVIDAIDRSYLTMIVPFMYGWIVQM